MNRAALISLSAFVLLSSCMTHSFTKTGGESEIYIRNDVKKELTESYSGRTKEKPYCLFGEDRKIDRIETPEILKSTDTKTEWDGAECEKQDDFLGYVHNHENAPTPSKLDEFRFALNDDSDVEVIAYQNGGDVSFHSYFLDEE